MKRMFFVLFILMQCGLLPAQDETAEQKRANEPVKFAVSVGAEYTDNRYAVKEPKKGGIDLYIKPLLMLDLKWEETMLALSYAPTFRYRNNPSDVDTKSQLFHDLALKLNHDLTRSLKVRLLENFDLTDDPSVQQNGSTLRRDYSYILSQTEVGMNYLFSRLSNMDAFGRYMVKRYDDNKIEGSSETSVAQESDLDKAEAGVTFFHQPGRNFALLGTALYSQYGYGKVAGVDRGFDSVLIGAGLEEVFSSNFRVGVRGGLQNNSYNDNSVESESSPYGSLSAQISGIPSTRITASLSQMIRESFLYPYSSQKSTELGLRLDWDSPVPDLIFALTGAYRMGDYDSENVPQGLTGELSSQVSDYGSKPSGKENTYAIAGEVAFKVGLGTKIKFVQSYENVDSDVRYSFNRNASNIMMIREF